MRRRRYGLTFRRRHKIKLNMNSVKSWIIWAGAMVFAFVLACLLVFFFGLQIRVVGQSMESTLYSGDTVLVNRFSYMMMKPDYEDVIVFKPNGNLNSHYHLKRVVGKPGDNIQIKNGRVYINDVVLKEHVSTDPMNNPGLAEEPIRIEKGKYFVLGDNRNESEDSRSADIGMIDENDILGKAWFIIGPKEHAGILK